LEVPTASITGIENQVFFRGMGEVDIMGEVGGMTPWKDRLESVAAEGVVL
jgi:hypothetical protein